MTIAKTIRRHCIWHVCGYIQSSEQKKDILRKEGTEFQGTFGKGHAAVRAQILDRIKRGPAWPHPEEQPPQLSPVSHVPQESDRPSQSGLDLALKLECRMPRMSICCRALSVFSKSGVTFRRRKWRDGQVGLFHYYTLFVDCRRP